MRLSICFNYYFTHKASPSAFPDTIFTIYINDLNSLTDFSVSTS